MRVVFALVLVAMLVMMVLGGCGLPPTEGPPSRPPSGPELAGRITEAGSTTVQPLAERLAEAFMALHPDLDIIIQGGGSSVGIKSAGEGTVDVGAASRGLSPSELAEYPDLRVFTIARDGIAVVVHPGVPVDGLTLEQVRGIFAGAITNWNEVGGPDAHIIVVAREEGSGTRTAFEEMVMEGALILDMAILQPSNGAVRTTISITPNSIGFLSFSYLGEGVKALSIEGVEPTEENGRNGVYPIVRPLNLVTRGEPADLVMAWLDFIFSDEGQGIVAEEYIPVR